MVKTWLDVGWWNCPQNGSVRPDRVKGGTWRKLACLALTPPGYVSNCWLVSTCLSTCEFRWNLHSLLAATDRLLLRKTQDMLAQAGPLAWLVTVHTNTAWWLQNDTCADGQQGQCFLAVQPPFNCAQIHWECKTLFGLNSRLFWINSVICNLGLFPEFTSLERNQTFISRFWPKVPRQSKCGQWSTTRQDHWEHD